MFVHEDDRRTLYEWAKGDFKECKVLVAKGGCVVGNHHHLKKDEHFFLVQGRARQVVIGHDQWVNTPAPFDWIVKRGEYHLFDLEEGSILLGAMTAPYDPDDEVEGKP